MSPHQTSAFTVPEMKLPHPCFSTASCSISMNGELNAQEQISSANTNFVPKTQDSTKAPATVTMTSSKKKPSKKLKQASKTLKENSLSLAPKNCTTWSSTATPLSMFPQVLQSQSCSTLQEIPKQLTHSDVSPAFSPLPSPLPSFVPEPLPLPPRHLIHEYTKYVMEDQMEKSHVPPEVPCYLLNGPFNYVDVMISEIFCNDFRCKDCGKFLCCNEMNNHNGWCWTVDLWGLLNHFDILNIYKYRMDVLSGILQTDPKTVKYIYQSFDADHHVNFDEPFSAARLGLYIRCWSCLSCSKSIDDCKLKCHFHMK